MPAALHALTVCPSGHVPAVFSALLRLHPGQGHWLGAWASAFLGALMWTSRLEGAERRLHEWPRGQLVGKDLSPRHRLHFQVPGSAQVVVWWGQVP